MITIDTETINKNGTLIPYLYCMYDGIKTFSFFGIDPIEIRKQLFKQLLRKKYNGYSVYAHILSRFYIIFLFKYICELHNTYGYIVKPIIKDGDVISIKIKNDKGVSITFKDSYLLLVSSLFNLSNTFNCQVKGIEPILKLSESLSIDEKYYAQEDISHYSKDVRIID
uniref:DNA polymerase n=1 Tax=Daedaleopsis nitida TaxID=1140402 RepID=UPI0030DF7CCB